MPKGREPPQPSRQGAWVVLLAFLALSWTPKASTISEQAALFWQLDDLIAQGHLSDARQLAQRNKTVASKVWMGLLLDRLEDVLTGEPAPLSTRADAVLSLLSDALPVECPSQWMETLQRLSADGQVSPDKLLPNIPSPLSKAIRQFLVADRAPLDRQIEEWQEAVRLCHTLGTELGFALSLHRLAWAERIKGSLTLAHALASEASAILRQWNHQTKLPRLLNTLGVISGQMGDYGEAERFLLDGLKMAEATRSRRWQVACLNNLSILYTRTRNYEEALRRAMQAMELISEHDPVRTRSGVLGNLGNIYRRLGDFEQALHYLRKAVDLAQSSGDLVLQAEALYLLGMAMRDKGETDNALKTLQEALQIRRKLNDPLGQVEVLNDIGDTLAKSQRFREARDYFEAALKLAEETKHLPSRAWTLLNLGAIYDELGEHERSLSLSKQALVLWQSVGDPWFMAWGWENIGDAYAHLGNRRHGDERKRFWTKALDAYWQSVRLIERFQQRVGIEMLRAEFLQTAVEPFHRLIDLLARMGRVEEALEVAERMRTQALLDVLRNAPPPTVTLLTETERQTYHQLQQNIATLERQIVAEMGREERDEHRIQSLRQTLEAARAEMARLRDAARLRQVGLKEEREKVRHVLPSLLQRLPSDLAVLSYIVTKERTWLFVAAPNGQRWQITAHAVPATETTLSEDVLWLRENILKRRSVAITARRLYELLIAPAELRLRGKRRLCIVPDGLLFSLPFQTLMDRNDNYLVERWVITYAPSLRWLTFQSPAPAARPPFRWTGLGVTQWRPPMPPLPFVRRELDEVAKLLGKEGRNPVRTFLDTQATKAKAQEALRTSQWVHFATHAILEPERAFYSRLLLTPSEGDNALRAYEVLEMGRLTAELVTLSACDTGQGKFVQGEGLIGLAWAFLAGGTHTLVASQWRVDDASTAFLMKHFYRHLLKGAPPSTALRSAQLAILRHPSYAHPFYWAPFIVWTRSP